MTDHPHNRRTRGEGSADPRPEAEKWKELRDWVSGRHKQTAHLSPHSLYPHAESMADAFYEMMTKIDSLTTGKSEEI